MELAEIAGVPIITALVFVVMLGYKYLTNGKENLARLIPIFAGLLGMILGVVAYYVTREIIPADNVFSAALIGCTSGLAATGGNEIYRQLTKTNCDQTTDATVEQTEPDEDSNEKE